jgi:hypothetical protein
MRLRHFLARWAAWEYHPWWLANVPVYLFWLWYAARARHLFFFSNVNPAIPLAGAMGESKGYILRLLPPHIVPKTLEVAAGEDFGQVLAALESAGIGFPLIAKPDVGERGFLVKKIENQAILRAHLARWPVRFLLQEFLVLPVEASVLYHVFPGEGGRFDITSLCLKEFLTVRGDGVARIGALMERDARAAFQRARFEREAPALLREIPAAGELRLLEPIGNHARGTKFLNGNHLINDAMRGAFEPICRQIQGVQYARFDLKAASLEALQRGEFKAMELNGVLGEPAHIYDPAHGMWRAYRDLWRHWRLLFELCRAQRRRGIQPTPHRAAFRRVNAYFNYKKRLNG